MTERSVEHATFAVERTYGAPPARVFAAFADSAAKARWFTGPADWEPIYVHPVVLGGGKPLFQEPGRIDLRLVETRRFGSGVVLLSYAAG